MKEKFIARFREEDKKEQLLVEHLKGVQVLAETIGSKLQIRHITGLAGLLHDLGKYSDAFQEYIQKAKNGEKLKKGTVDHASAGGYLLFERYYEQDSIKISKVLIESISNSIFSHHHRLKDMLQAGEYSPFWSRKDKVRNEEDYVNAKRRFFGEVMSEKELDEYVQKANVEFESLAEKAKQIETQFNSINRKYWLETMLTNYIFSVLIESDWTNSRIFDEEKEDIEFDTQQLFNEYEASLEKYLNNLKKRSELDFLREEMSKRCLDYATRPPGIYTLSIPTGGGKTLSSLRYALKHAQQKKKKERIFYFVPFTTIIEQNVKIVKEALKTEGILEHHSNIIESEKIEDDTFIKDDWNEKRLKETWDAPIIFTTMVQFLNVFYTGKRRDVRRLHTLANSIIIFDEVQAVPIKCISLFNEALNFLAHFMNATIILCTATQPALQHVRNNLLGVNEEIIGNLPVITEAFQRTQLVNLVRPEGWNTIQLAELILKKLNELDNILIILNTKKAVKALYELFKNLEEYNVIHLSTSMCAAHRKDVIGKLFDSKTKKTVCISTQLIEAGVDVSFQCVIRSLAGLDSIAQAAGRCNRNGEVAIRDVYIINHGEESLRNLETIEHGANITKKILRFYTKSPEKFGGDLLSNMALDIYFINYYTEMKKYLDFPIRHDNTINNILFTENSKYKSAYIGEPPFEMRASFATAGYEFSAISSRTTAILVPYGKGKELITQISAEKTIVDINEFIKKAQPYIVNVFTNVLNTLIHNRLIGILRYGESEIYCAIDTAYSIQYGLDEDGEAELIFCSL